MHENFHDHFLTSYKLCDEPLDEGRFGFECICRWEPPSLYCIRERDSVLYLGMAKEISNLP